MSRFGTAEWRCAGDVPCERSWDASCDCVKVEYDAVVCVFVGQA